MKQGRLFILLFTILLFLPGITKADEYIDSLPNVISRHLIENHVDSVLNTRLVLIKYVRFSDFELFLDLSKSNIELAKKENLNWGQIDTYMELGEVFILKGIFSEALNNLNEALKLAEIDEYRPYIGWVSISIGNAYEGMFAFNKAIDFYQKSFQVFEETDNTDGMALASTNIGSCYQELNELDKAEMFLTRGLKYYKQIDDPVNLGYVQMYLAELKIIRGKYNEAKSDLASLTYSVQELILNNKDASASNEAQNLLSVVLWLLSDCENHLGNTQKSISYLKNAVALNSKSGNFINLATFYNLLGNSYLAEKQYNLALVFADSAATIAKNERIFIEEAKSYQLFSNIYSGLNKPDKALNYYKQYKSINDSIYNNAVIQAISDVDVLVHTVEKEKTIKFWH